MYGRSRYGMRGYTGAPEEYEALLGFVFAHMDDEEPRFRRWSGDLFEWLQMMPILFKLWVDIVSKNSIAVRMLDDVDRGADGFRAQRRDQSAYSAEDIAGRKPGMAGAWSSKTL